MTTDRSPGRRPGESTAREDLLAAARAEFGAAGFDKATLRSIAARAGVDPAMIKHYFGSKQGLFAAAVELPFDPGAIVADVLRGDRDQLGNRLAATFLTMWDSAGGAAATSTVRTAVGSPEAGAALHDFLINRVMRHGLTQLMGWTPEARWRASLVASQLVGLLVTRYIVPFAPLADAEVDEVVRGVGPTLQRYLTGDLGAVPRTGGG
ncbi:TetR/AcrR family transcriptional regulator [Cumulibacter manganitolerans]|uniref:TetR/AcrR family transcriptional regulator n=1 Tax=Cumulibacter manganitolerans TaxID=1884992 RepID=UPI00129730DD|nr:TetR family transcriptional regulator [Cumulibacter manganitolerans]